MRSNEELLKAGGECPRRNCIEVAGHTGPCSGDLSYDVLLAQLREARGKLEAVEEAKNSWADSRAGWACQEDIHRILHPQEAE